jgi:hypothetical protein
MFTFVVLLSVAFIPDPNDHGRLILFPEDSTDSSSDLPLPSKINSTRSHRRTRRRSRTPESERTPPDVKNNSNRKELPETSPTEVSDDLIARQDLPFGREDPDEGELQEPSETFRIPTTGRHQRKRLSKEMHFGLSLVSLFVVVAVVSVVSFLVVYCYRRPANIELKGAEIPLLIVEIQDA